MIDLANALGIEYESNLSDTQMDKVIKDDINTAFDVAENEHLLWLREQEIREEAPQLASKEVVTNGKKTIESMFLTTNPDIRLIEIRYRDPKDFRIRVEKKEGDEWVHRPDIKFDGEDFKALPFQIDFYLEREDKIGGAVVVEGVKCAHALNEHLEECKAVTSIGGSNQAHKTDWTMLKHGSVTFIPDCDEPGKKYVNDVAKQILSLAENPATKMNIFLEVIDLHPLAQKNPDIKGYDIADYLESGGTYEILTETEEDDDGYDVGEYWCWYKDWKHNEQPIQIANRRIHFSYTDLNFDLLEECFKQIEVNLRWNTRDDSPQIFEQGRWKELRHNRELSFFAHFRNYFTYQKNGGKKPQPINFGADARKLNLSLYYEQRRVDPFREWIESLPKWDEKERLSNLLNDMFGMHDERYQKLYEWASRFLFVGVIRRTYEPGCQLRQVPVLIGKQNIGKSALLRSILPTDMQEDLFGDTLNMMSDSLAQVEAIKGKVIVEVSELVGLKKAELSKIKSFLTRRNDEIRMAYAPRKEKNPRECIIVGTTNDDACLPNDPSGNSRFVSLKLKHGCAVENYMDRHREQLWAEALFIYRNKKKGYKALLTYDLFSIQEELNDVHKRVNTEVDDLIDLLDVNDITGKTSTDIRTYLSSILEERDIFIPRVNLFGPALISKGYTQMHVRKGRRWFKSRQAAKEWNDKMKLLDNDMEEEQNQDSKYFGNGIYDIEK